MPSDEPPTPTLKGFTVVVDRNGLHVYGLVAYATNWPELVGSDRDVAIERVRAAIGEKADA